MQFHERIKGLREDHDLKQEVLAAYLGITRQQYSLYETGRRTFSVLWRVCLRLCGGCLHHRWRYHLCSGLRWLRHGVDLRNEILYAHLQ